MAEAERWKRYTQGQGLLLKRWVCGATQGV